MDISTLLKTAFPDALTDFDTDSALIAANTDLQWLPKVKQNKDLFALVPRYMYWCSQSDDMASLVFDDTIRALAEYGRCKKPELAHLNFAYLCNRLQKQAVIQFLVWCLHENSTLDATQIKRAIRNWRTMLASTEN